MNNDESFKSRLHKVFDSLPSSSPSSAAWFLADGEVEKKEWKRSALKQGKDDDDQTLCSSSYDGLFKHNRRRNITTTQDVLNDDDDDNGSERNNDVWEIRSSIGLDSTLDNEEEEDEYDRVAEGRVGAGDRLYMKNISDQETSSDPSGNNILRDPRANHMAAQVRLKEDADATEKCESHFDGITLSSEQHSTTSLQDRCEVKPILKRKSKSEDGGVKPMKRVRFDPSCKDECQGASEQEVSWAVPTSLNSTSQEDDSIYGGGKPKVPDYVLNPSKYTCYTLDSSSEIDDESNSEACSNLLEEIKKSKHDQLALETTDVSGTSPNSVVFIPRQKNTNATATNSELKGMFEEACNESLHPKGFPVGVGIAVEEAKKCEDPMEEDIETHMADNVVATHKPERRYRTKSQIEDSVT